MSSTDTGERTEPATPKRLREARKEGKIGTSRDLGAWLGIAAVVAMIPFCIPAIQEASQRALAVIPTVVRTPDIAIAEQTVWAALEAALPAILPLLIGSAVAIIGGTVVQGGIHPRGIQFKAEHLNPISGFRRIFGVQALWEGAKALIKTLVVGAAMYVVIQSLMPLLVQAGALSLSGVLAGASGGLWGLLIVAIVAGLVISALDVFVVMRRNRRHTRMTKKELRDEMKQQEGDPLVRSHRRARAIAMSRNRMIQATADADVILLNPTHLAVALVYEPGVSAPRLVAKGADEIALRIREKGEEAGIPMVRDVALARSIYHTCELGDEIPAALYLAVARVLAFVMALRTRGAARGTHDFNSASPELERR